jgi:hypothetical protein
MGLMTINKLRLLRVLTYTTLFNNIYGLFNDAVGNSDYTDSKDRISHK